MSQNNYPTGSAEYINRLNKIKVLNLIREAGQISRAEVVKKTGLSAPTITRIVDSLINKERLVKQVGIGEASLGRPPLIVQFNGEDRYVIGLDWGRTHIFGMLANLNGKSLCEIDVPFESNHDFNQDLARVIELIQRLLNDSQVETDKLMGIGVAAAGFINKKTNLVEFSPNFRWSNVDIGRPLKERFQVPVIVDNVSRVMAMGELLYGIGSHHKDFLFVNIGYGIGSGMVMNGQPFLGFDGISGELGHTRVMTKNIQPLQCACGKFDCLECYASGRGIAEIAQKGIKAYPDSILNELCEGDYSQITSKAVAQGVVRGDRFCQTVFDQAAEYLGLAIASAANLLNPELIILGGKVANSNAWFVEKVRSVFDKEVLSQPSRKIEIKGSTLGNEAAVKGAISLILQDILRLQV